LSRDCLFITIPRQQWSKLDGLDAKGLKAVFRYKDGQAIDDALLTRAVMRSAELLGAEFVLNVCFKQSTTGIFWCKCGFFPKQQMPNL